MLLFEEKVRLWIEGIRPDFSALMTAKRLAGWKLATNLSDEAVCDRVLDSSLQGGASRTKGGARAKQGDVRVEQGTVFGAELCCEVGCLSHHMILN